MSFQVGDIVRLNSGGPWMTVTSVSREGQVYCVWFPSDDASKRDHFPPQALIKGDGA